jgi:hypothetical protein
VAATAGREANGINTAIDTAAVIDAAAREAVPGRSGRLLWFGCLNLPGSPTRRRHESPVEGNTYR